MSAPGGLKSRWILTVWRRIQTASDESTTTPVPRLRPIVHARYSLEFRSGESAERLING